MTQVSAHPKHFLSDKVEHFTESVIREMTRQAMQYDAVNLAQGFPDFAAPAEIKRAAQEAIAADVNQYAITWGAKNLRDAIVRQMRLWQGIEVDPERELRAAFHHQTKAIIVNTPNNPTGKVFTRSELELIRDLCVEFNVLAITDEIYEHILYDGTQHISIASLDGMRERTVTINGLSKTYSVTGWRVGWAVAPPAITDAIRKVHDFLTVGAPAPLQQAGATALSLPPVYYDGLAEGYRKRRDRLIPVLDEVGFRCFRPRGAYYVM